MENKTRGQKIKTTDERLLKGKVKMTRFFVQLLGRVRVLRDAGSRRVPSTLIFFSSQSNFGKKHPVALQECPFSS